MTVDLLEQAQQQGVEFLFQLPDGSYLNLSPQQMMHLIEVGREAFILEYVLKTYKVTRSHYQRWLWWGRERRCTGTRSDGKPCGATVHGSGGDLAVMANFVFGRDDRCAHHRPPVEAGTQVNPPER